MSKRRSSLGLSEDEIWTQIATDIGGEFIDRGFWDKNVVIKGNSPEKIKLLLADDRIRELCQRLPRIHLWIKDDEGMFGTDFPEGVLNALVLSKRLCY